MIIAISAREDDLNTPLDLAFGRTKGFIIYNTEDDTHTFIDNIQNLQAPQGAGIQAAQNVINKDVKALITGHCGPNAFKVLSQYGVKVYTSEAIKISEVIEKFKKNELATLNDADVEGHWV